MKIITDIAEVENEVFKASIYNLYILLQQKIPEFFGSQSYNIYVHDDFAEVVWTTKKQVMAEDFTDMLEKKSVQKSFMLQRRKMEESSRHKPIRFQ